jgi:hypothetical protein
MTIKVLSGVRVVEHGTFITGPAASMLLADLGADVVKVEQPAGDPFRAFRGGLYSPHYQTYNRNKKSVSRSTRARRPTWRCSTSWSPRPTSTSRTSVPAWPRRSAPARRACAS